MKSADKLKEDIIHLIEQVVPIDEIEVAAQQRMTSWIRSTNEIFRTVRPAIPPVHLCCYSVLYDKKSGKLLLLQSTKAEGLWLPSGGHPEKGENPADGIIRELQEELGISPVPLFDQNVPFFLSVCETVGSSFNHTDMDLWFVFQYDSSRPFEKDSSEFKREFGEYGWFTFDEILRKELGTLDINMHRFVRKLKVSLSEQK